MPSDRDTSATSPSLPHVVIVGAGFGGLYAAKSLAQAPVRVTIIDRRNHHLFQALLYQVATAALSPADIAQPIRVILRHQKNVTVLMAEVRGVNVDARTVAFDNEELAYDYLIIATGSSHSYFGHESWPAIAPGLKSLEDAIEIRRRILTAFERAERETDPARRSELLTFAVIGAGPTGVELAGALAEISRKTLVFDFDHFDPRETKVLLLEAGDRVLPTFPKTLSRRAERSLKKLGVDVRLGKPVTDLRPGIVRLGDEEIVVGTVLWAAGVSPSPLAKAMDVPLDRGGRVSVEPDLTLAGNPEVFVVGDLTSLTDPRGRLYQGLAPVAIQQGQWAAANIVRAVAGQPMTPFRYVDRGTMATIGRSAAIADIRGLRLSGFVAWLAWAVVHIYLLIGFRYRLVVAIQWLWSYLTYQRGARLITGPTDQRGSSAETEGESSLA